MINDIKKIALLFVALLASICAIFLKGKSSGKREVKNNINKAKVKDYERANKIKRNNSELDRDDVLNWLSDFQDN